MKNQLDDLYKQILFDIAECTSQNTESKKWIENCFSIASSTWLKEDRLLENYRFESEEKETWFFKEMKPKITGIIEFFSLLYKAEMFIPDSKWAWPDYWRREARDTINFFEGNEDLYNYYKSGATNMDATYFLKKNGTIPRDQLIASFIAREKYLRYIERKEDGRRIGYESL